MSGPVGITRTAACFTGIRILDVVSRLGCTSGWSNDSGVGTTPPPVPEIVRVPRIVGWKMQWNL